MPYNFIRWLNTWLFTNWIVSFSGGTWGLVRASQEFETDGAGGGGFSYSPSDPWANSNSSFTNYLGGKGPGESSGGGILEIQPDNNTSPPRINPYSGSIVDQIVRWMEYIAQHKSEDIYLDEIVNSYMFPTPYDGQESLNTKGKEGEVYYFIKNPRSSAAYNIYTIENYIKYNPSDNSLSLHLMRSDIRSFEGPRIIFIQSNNADLIWLYYCYIKHIDD